MPTILLCLIPILIIVSSCFFYPAYPDDPYEDLFNDVDELLKNMIPGNIAFNVPQSMNFNETAIIELVLGIETDIDELKQMIMARGYKEGAFVLVHNHMEARLSGSNFDITAIHPEKQAVPREAETFWKWEIKPKKKGIQTLHLTLSAVMDVNGVNTKRSVETFSRDIEIEVTPREQFEEFLKSNWQWLWAAVLAPVVGWFWNRRRKK